MTTSPGPSSPQVIRAEVLLENLRAGDGGNAIGISIPPLLTALASWESRLELGRVGDKDRTKNGSLGLWQVNQDVWARTIGPFDRGRAGVRDDNPQEAALAYEIDYVMPVVARLLPALDGAMDRLTQAAGAGQIDVGAIAFDPIGTPAEWASIWWQYGATKFDSWTRSSRFRFDATAAGFKSWAIANKVRLEADFDKRQSFIVTRYRRFLSQLEAHQVVAFWLAHSGRFGVDFGTAALASLGATAAQRQAWSASTGALAKTIRFPSSAAATASVEPGPVLSVAVPVLLVSGLSAAAYYLLFEPDPVKGHRKVSDDVVAWLKSTATGTVLSFGWEMLRSAMKDKEQSR